MQGQNGHTRTPRDGTQVPPWSAAGRDTVETRDGWKTTGKYFVRQAIRFLTLSLCVDRKDTQQRTTTRVENICVQIAFVRHCIDAIA